MRWRKIYPTARPITRNFQRTTELLTEALWLKDVKRSQKKFRVLFVLGDEDEQKGWRTLACPEAAEKHAKRAIVEKYAGQAVRFFNGTAFEKEGN